jgi:hypothetical protein
MHSLFKNKNNNNNNTPLLQKKSCGQKISKTMKKLTCTPVRASPFAIAKNTKKAMEDPCINQSINRSLGKKKEKNKKTKKPSRMI